MHGHHIGIPTDGPKPGVMGAFIVEPGAPAEPPRTEKESSARSGYPNSSFTKRRSSSR